MVRRKFSGPRDEQGNIERIQATNKRLDDMEREFGQLQQRLDHFRQKNLNAASKTEQYNELLLDNTLNLYSEKLNALELKSSQSIAAQADYYQNEYVTFQSDLWEQATGNLEKQSGWLQAALEEQQATQQFRISQLQNSVIAVQQDLLRCEESAQETLQSCLELFNRLQIQYNENPIWRAGLTGLILQLHQVRSNLDSGFEEAALAGGQQLYQQLINLADNIDTYIENKQSTINLAQSLAEKIVEEIKENQSVHAIDLKGNLLHIELYVDFWSDSKLSALFDQVQNILERIKISPFHLDLNEINYLENRLMIIQEKISEIIFQARMQALSSQMRFNIAETALSALRTQGYELNFGEFIEKDMRRSYHMEMENLGGSQVIIMVSPILDHPFIQNLELEMMEPKTISDHELRHRTHEVETALNYYGLRIGQIIGPSFMQGQEPGNQQPVLAPSWMQPGIQKSVHR